MSKSLTDDAADKARLLQAALSSGTCSKPEQYAAGSVTFCGHVFVCDPRALIPRFETEYLVKEIAAWCEAKDPNYAWSIADIGTGSGVIAISLALRLAHARICASDISADALAMAKDNAQRHGVSGRIRFVEGPFLAPMQRPVDVIAANL